MSASGTFADDLGSSSSWRRKSRLGPADDRQSRRQSLLRPGADDFEEDEMIDPELRLRTVRTAGASLAGSAARARVLQTDPSAAPPSPPSLARLTASAIAVSIHNEERANRTRRFLGLGRRTDRDPETKRSSIRGKRRFSGKTPADAKPDDDDAPAAPAPAAPAAKGAEPVGSRRNVYVNLVRRLPLPWRFAPPAPQTDVGCPPPPPLPAPPAERALQRRPDRALRPQQGPHEQVHDPHVPAQKHHL